MRRWAAARAAPGGADRPLADRRLDRRLADVLSLEDFLVPSPAEIAESLWENRALLAENAWVTLREILLGILCALVVGSPSRS